jgi:arylsulfatase
MFGIAGDEHTVDNYDDWARVGGWSSSYGQGWANLSNVPFRQYKRENHEGGVSAPFVIHWPKGIQEKGALRHQPAHLIDLMPTFVDVAGAKYPTKYKGHKIQPMEGRSLRAWFGEGESIEPRTLFWEHEGNRAVRDGDWKLVGTSRGPWELYHIAKDRTELNNVAELFPDKFTSLQAKWDAWAEKVNVLTPDEFIATRTKAKARQQAAKNAAN